MLVAQFLDLREVATIHSDKDDRAIHDEVENEQNREKVKPVYRRDGRSRLDNVEQRDEQKQKRIDRKSYHQ